MTLSPYLAHTETLFINLEILPLDRLIFKQDCNNDVYKLDDELKLISFHSYNNDMLPSVMHELYKKNN